MLSLESEIHYQTQVVDGKKLFGQFDSMVARETSTVEHPLNPGKPEVTVIISTMEREAKFSETLSRLIDATKKLGLLTRIVVMDNSLKPLGENLIPRVIPLNLESIVHHHNARMIQSTARNFAVLHLSDQSPNLVFSDGDIYCGRETLKNLHNGLLAHPRIKGVAPVMMGYKGGNVDSVINQPIDLAKSHMPGVIGEQIWIREGDIMRATMMRGFFWVMREMVDSVAKSNFEHTPWLQDFVVWQNVPFSIVARELGWDFAYLVNGQAVVAHDDRVDELSIGYKLPYRGPETLKSLVMLMYRNSVYTPQGRIVNPRFLEFNLSAITRVAQVDTPLAIEIQELLLHISELINISTDVDDFKARHKTMINAIPGNARNILDKTIECICVGNTFTRIKNNLSLKPSRMIYSVED